RYLRYLQRLLANVLPLALILLSLYCYLNYLSALDEAVSTGLSRYSDFASRHDVLEKLGQREPIPSAKTLQYCYLGIFLSAELAFVVMALREYAYGVLRIPEAKIMGGDVPTR